MYSNPPHQDTKPALGCLAAPLTAQRYFLLVPKKGFTLAKNLIYANIERKD